MAPQHSMHKVKGIKPVVWVRFAPDTRFQPCWAWSPSGLVASAARALFLTLTKGS